MKPIKVSHLSLAFFGLILIAILGLGALMSVELKQLTERIRAQENRAAIQEIREGLGRMESHLRSNVEALSRWDETRQQLVYPDYYTLWRDMRVRDAGMVPAFVRGVALYDKQGRILSAPRGESMPVLTPGRASHVQFSGVDDSRYIYAYFPIFAEPSSTILLGHGAIKVDLLGQFRQAHTYRYADLESLKLRLRPELTDSLADVIDRIDYVTLPNRDLSTIKDMIQVTFMRLLGAMLIILALGAWFSKRALIGPLNRISQDIDLLKEVSGAEHSFTPLKSPMRIQELENVRRAFSEYHEKLALLHQDLEKNSRDFFDQAHHDALTGAFNRRAFNEDWRSLADAGYLGKCALLLFDCDHFKPINDTYGHGVGDLVIQAIASNLTQALRTGDRLYRLGGDEFATVLPNSDAASAQAVAERCLRHIQSHDFQQYGLKEPVLISIGIALSEHAAFSLHELHSQADLAMYNAKRPGNCKFVFYDSGIEGMSNPLANLRVNAVYRAVQQDQIIDLHYQPIVTLPDARPIYVEALARIRQGDDLLVPEQFMGVVHAQRLDVEFDLAVLRSLDDAILGGRLPADAGLSINISSQGIVDHRVIQALLDFKSRETQRSIVIEINENALIQQLDKAGDSLGRLRAAGFLTALDDFGSAYSSLRTLSALPVDWIKFDISMTRLLAEGDNKQRQTVGEFAHIIRSNGYRIVAEGVETEAQRARVIELGFDFAQGLIFDTSAVAGEAIGMPDYAHA
jgi:diguanylate cyclase (GGDEF)-like protein